MSDMGRPTRRVARTSPALQVVSRQPQASLTPSLCGFDLCAAGVLADAEDHELGGFHGRDSDDRHHHACVDDVGWVRFLVALDEERLLGSRAHECTVTPDACEEGADVAPDRLPELAIVRLEHDPA